jgi:hypothetical protein
MYRTSGFGKCATQNGWSIELLGVEVDPEKLTGLNPASSSAAEISNSMRVY